MKKTGILWALGLLVLTGFVVFQYVGIQTIEPHEMGDEAARQKINHNFEYLGSRIDSVGGGIYDTLTIGGQKIYYDTTSRVVAIETGVDGVVNNTGEELWYLVYNDTGDTLKNGTPVFTAGVNATYDVLEVDSAKASTLQSLSTLGLATHDILPDSLGLVTWFGMVRDFNTSGLIAGIPVYLGADGGLTNTKPTYPNQIILMGSVLKVSATEGMVNVALNRLTREQANKSYNFTSQGIGAGTYWRAGFYDYSTTDANLTQASTTVTFGTANHPYSAHPFIVAGGAGTVDAGTVGLRVTGTSIDDSGNRTASDADTITTDITSLSLNGYAEAKKFIGTVTFELIVTSGTPTTYSLDFNYGTAKYEDVGNREFSIAGIEAVGLAGANDASYDMTLFHHSDQGWTYAATSFEAGGTVICDWSTDMAPEDDLASGQDFAWKRANLNTFVDGDDSEGVIIKIVTGANNSIQSMDVHLSGRIESF